jgi:hypothetical protein
VIALAAKQNIGSRAIVKGECNELIGLIGRKGGPGIQEEQRSYCEYFAG